MSGSWIDPGMKCAGEFKEKEKWSKKLGSHARVVRHQTEPHHLESHGTKQKSTDKEKDRDEGHHYVKDRDASGPLGDKWKYEKMYTKK